jgi:hypothetical protein
MTRSSAALSTMALREFEPHPAAQAKGIDVSIAIEAAISRLLPNQDGDEQWEVHRGSAATVSGAPAPGCDRDNVLTQPGGSLPTCISNAPWLNDILSEQGARDCKVGLHASTRGDYRKRLKEPRGALPRKCSFVYSGGEVRKFIWRRARRSRLCWH